MKLRKTFTVGFIIAVGNFLAAMVSFFRNLILARIISVEDFGIASTIALTMSIIELTSDFGIDRLLVQDADGDDPKLQACAHGFQVIRGCFSTITLFLIAPPIAALFRIPDAAWALRWVSLAPLIRSFCHLDFARFQRTMSFAPAAVLDLIPITLTTAITFPLMIRLGDYRVSVWIVLLQSLIYTIVSHAIAKRPYQMAYDRETIRKMVAFGWPLVLNGLFLFGSFHGDRAIVGVSFSIRELGWYTVAVSIMSVPANLILRVLRSGMLPALSRLQNDPIAFQSRLELCAEAALCISTAFGLIWLLGGPSLLILTFGPKYADSLVLIPLFALVSTVRILRPDVAAVALGDTKNTLIASIIRLVSFPLGIVSVYLGFGIYGVVVTLLIGEIMGVIIATMLYHRISGTSYPIPLLPWVMFLICISIAYCFSSVQVSETNLLTNIGFAMAMTLLGTGAVAFVSPSLSRILRTTTGFGQRVLRS